MTLKEAMAYRGENADTLAEKIGIRAGEITKWMRPAGLLRVPSARLQQLAVALDGGVLVTADGVEAELYGSGAVRERRQRMSKTKQWLAAALAAVMVLGLTACGSGEEQENTESEPAAGTAVQVQSVTLDSIATENTVSGQVTAEDTSTIFVSVAAKCTAVNYEAGDIVNAGDVICTLDLGSTISSYNAANINYQSSVQGYQDQAAVFQSQIELYQKNVNDLKALFEIGAASQAEIDQAELQLQSAIATRNSTLAQLEAGMESAKSSVEQLSTALENVDGAGNVIAPMSGTLVTMNAVENSFISTTMPVAVIDGADQMKVTVSVAETLVPKLTIGDSADVSVSAAGQTFTGTIRAVERSANQQTKLYTVTLGVPADVSGLLSGMSAEVTFHTDRSDNTVVVPSECILSSGESQYVYIVTDDTAKKVEVTTGLTSSGVTEVTSGLQEGDQLVVVGQAYLEDGTPVRIVDGED